MRIVLLGAPGSGKGTQAEQIVANNAICHISTGDLLRAEVAAGSELGQQAKGIMEAGGLVSDDIMLGMIENRLQQDDAANGFLLDGFPRTEAQAIELDVLLTRIGQPLDLVIYFDVNFDEIMTRLLARGRADDNEETIRKRLEVYQQQTAPLIELYRGQNKLSEVHGEGSVEEIGQRISAAIDAARS